MLFRVLGDVGKVGPSCEVAISSAQKRRALLALLVLHAPRSVNRSLTLETLWGENLPDHPEAALQVAISRLRTELGTYGECVVTEAGGYRLEVDPQEVDVHRAEALLRDGRASLANNDPFTAATKFEEALAPWTEDCLREFVESTFFRDARARLTELRYAVVEARNDAYLADGRHLEVLVDIEAWLSGEPFREHLRAQHIAALYRAGRQVDAIRRCESFRRLLRDEVGLDLSPPMRELEHRVLNHDVTLLARGAGFMTTLPAWTGDFLPFIGRTAEHELVKAHFLDAIREGLRLVVVEGEPGIGKSRFLLEVARRLGSDAIVMVLHARGAFTTPLRELCLVLCEVLQTLSDEELGIIAEDFPDILPEHLPQVRETINALASRGEHDRVPDDDIKKFAAPWIAALSAKAPVIVVIDDLETAGASVLDVLTQLSSLETPKRVLFLGSTRGGVDHAFPHLARVVSALDESGLVARIELPSLALHDVDELLSRMRVEPRVRLVDRLYDLTGGNALLLAELLSSGPAERIIDDWPTRPRIRDIVRKRTAELGRAAAELLKCAAQFEQDFTVELLAEVSGATPPMVAGLVDRAVEAHVLQPSTLTSFRFAHQLFRQTLVADLSARQRSDGHRRIASALERAGAAPAMLAAHWSAAEGDDVPAKVAKYAREAGRNAMALFEAEAAVRWFGLALAYLPDERERGSVLADLGEAQQFAGDSGDLASLREATSIAVETHDDALTMKVVRVTTPGWSTLPGITGPDGKHLLARALELAEDDATRSRVLARVAVEESFLDPVSGDRTCDAALALARRSGDDSALAEALFRRASLLMTPCTLAERRLVVEELVTLTFGSTDIAMRYFAVSNAEVTAVQACDMVGADACRAEAESLASQYDLSPVRWSAMLRRVWRTGLSGDFETAAAHIEQAAAFGDAHGAAHARDLALIQRRLMAWQRGDTVAATPLARAAHDGFSATFPGATLLLARFLIDDHSTRSEAEALLAGFTTQNFDNLPDGPFWSTALVIAAETAHCLQQAEACETIRDLLLPHVEQIAFSGMWVIAPVAYGLGVAATGCGDERAESYFAEAAAGSERLRAPVISERVARARAHRA